MEIKNKKFSKQIKYSAIAVLLFLCSFSTSNSQTPGMWVMQSTHDTSYTYNSVYFSNYTTGWICGSNGKIFKTTNGGWEPGGWTQQLTNSYQNYLQKITGVGTDGKYVYACGYVNNSNPPAAVILQTSNGGTIWTNNTINYLNFKAAHFINAYTGFIVGSRTDSMNTGRIYKTTNAGSGASVTTYSSYTEDNVLRIGQFRAISFINTNTGWITATNSSNVTTIVKTTNMGNSWMVTGSSIYGIYVNDIKFINEATGFLCGGAENGGRARILKTIDSGKTWTEKVYFEANAFSSMSWIYGWVGNVQQWRGFAVGENGMVLRSDDLGATWTQQETPAINNLNGVYFVNNKVGWAVGNNAAIITTYNAGVLVNNISSAVPDGYKVYQNYPNPFNPTTTIKFDIMKSDFIKLEIYDQIGRKIEDLVSENLKPGSYSVTWDAASKPSGVYYYRITASDFTKTMKMSLVK